MHISPSSSLGPTTIYLHRGGLRTTNRLRVLIGIIPIFLLQFLNQFHVSLLRLLLGKTFIDDFLPGAFLGFALLITLLVSVQPQEEEEEEEEKVG
jgi:hypothetical protein